MVPIGECVVDWSRYVFYDRVAASFDDFLSLQPDTSLKVRDTAEFSETMITAVLKNPLRYLDLHHLI
jgi:hypothetical protein